MNKQTDGTIVGTKCADKQALKSRGIEQTDIYIQQHRVDNLDEQKNIFLVSKKNSFFRN